MLSLDLFNTVYERALNEGAVDDLEARRIHGLNTKMLDLMSRAKDAKPEMKAALMREYAKIKDERDSYFKIREGGIPGNVPTEKIPGKEDLLKGKGRSYYEGQAQKKNSKQVNEYLSMASDKNFVEAPSYKNYKIYVRKKPFGNTGLYTAHTEIDRKGFMEKGSSQEEAVQAIRDRIDFVLNAQKKVTGSSTIDFNVKFATDLLADPRQTFYAKLENVNGEPKLVIAGTEVANDPELLAASDFKRSALRNQVDDQGRATPLPGIPLTAKGLRSGEWIANGRYTIGKETQDQDGNRVFDLTYHSTAHTKSDKLRLNQPAFTLGTTREVDEDRASNPMDQRLQRLKVKARREYPRAQTDDEAVALKILDKEQQDVTQLSRENDREDRLISRLADLEQNLQQQIDDLKQSTELDEHGGGIGPKQHWQDLMQERKLNVGDPVVVTAPNEFEGKTGEIAEFSPSGKFVVVNLYNHGEHSMHLSDVEFNQYAADQDQDDWYDDEVAEGWSDAVVARRTGRPRTPYSVYIKGRKWKDFENDDHAEAVANKLRAKFKADGRDPSVITIAPTDYDKGMTEADETSWTANSAKFRQEEDMSWTVEVTLEPRADVNKGRGRQVKTQIVTAPSRDAAKKKLADYYRKNGWAVTGIKFAGDLDEAGGDKKPKRTHTNDCSYQYGHDCDCKGTLTHANDCHYRYGHDCDCGLDDLKNRRSNLELDEFAPGGIYKPPVIPTNPGKGPFEDDPRSQTVSKVQQLLDAGKSVFVLLPGARGRAIDTRIDDDSSWLIVQYKGWKDPKTRSRSRLTVNLKADDDESLHLAPGSQFTDNKDRPFDYTLSGEAKTSGRGLWEQDVAEAETDYSKRRQRERDVDAGKPVPKQRPSKQTDYQKRRAQDKKEMELGEEQLNEFLPALAAVGAAIGRGAASVGSAIGRSALTTGARLGASMAMGNDSDEVDEEKVRLDPKCWSGKKIGTPKTKMKGGVRVNNCVPAESINEEQDTSGVESAIIRRIMTSHTDLLMKFGPEKVMQAAEEVAYNVGDVDEVGSSDVSAWVHEVKQILGAV